MAIERFTRSEIMSSHLMKGEQFVVYRHHLADKADELEQLAEELEKRVERFTGCQIVDGERGVKVAYEMIAERLRKRAAEIRRDEDA